MEISYKQNLFRGKNITYLLCSTMLPSLCLAVFDGAVLACINSLSREVVFSVKTAHPIISVCLIENFTEVTQLPSSWPKEFKMSITLG